MYKCNEKKQEEDSMICHIDKVKFLENPLPFGHFLHGDRPMPVEQVVTSSSPSLNMAAKMIATGEASRAVTLGAQEESKNDAEINVEVVPETNVLWFGYPGVNARNVLCAEEQQSDLGVAPAEVNVEVMTENEEGEASEAADQAAVTPAEVKVTPAEVNVEVMPENEGEHLDPVGHLESDMLLFRRDKKVRRDSFMARESADVQTRLQSRTQMLLRHMSTTIQKEVDGQASCIDLMIFMVYVVLMCTILYMQMNVGSGTSTMYRSLIDHMFTVESGVVNAHDASIKDRLKDFDEFYDWIDEVCAAVLLLLLLLPPHCHGDMADDGGPTSSGWRVVMSRPSPRAVSPRAVSARRLGTPSAPSLRTVSTRRPRRLSVRRPRRLSARRPRRLSLRRLSACRLRAPSLRAPSPRAVSPHRLRAPPLRAPSALVSARRLRAPSLRAPSPRAVSARCPLRLRAPSARLRAPSARASTPHKGTAPMAR